MSYDFYIHHPDGPHGTERLELVANYTSNCRTAFNFAFDETRWHEYVNGASAGAAAGVIRNAIGVWYEMSTVQQDIIWPKADWGNARSAFAMLSAVAWHCEQAPKGSTLEINW